jgi:hypothetical protein
VTVPDPQEPVATDFPELHLGKLNIIEAFA